MNAPHALELGALSAGIALAAGPPVIWTLRNYGVGKKLRADGPQWHAAKEGTLTMGGLIFFIAILLVTAAFNLWGKRSIFLPLGIAAGCGVLGAVDDLLNLTGGTRTGLTARFKTFWLLAMAAGAAFVLHYSLDLTSVYVPWAGKYDIGAWYLPIAIFFVVGFANAVNITDGLDALAGGTAAFAFAGYGVIAALQGQDYLSAFCFTVMGGVLGFLWYNAHPARVMMGDTGSLALGATLAVVAFMTGHWLLLPLVGIVFAVDTASVMLQVAYFKLTRGKRLFRMAPLHHHFELSGWAETQVTTRFWLVGAAGALLGIALALS